MLQLSMAAILEKNRIASDNVWLILLEVQCPDGEVIRLCSDTQDQIWNGELWTAFPFVVDSVKQNKTEVPQVPVRIGNQTRAIERFVEHYGGLVGCTVVLRVVMSKHLEITVPEIEETFTVQTTSSNEEWVTFNLGGSLPVMLRYPFRRILKDWCPLKYKGIECGATSSQPDCPHTLNGCRERNNSTRFGGEPGMAVVGIYGSNG